MHAIKVQYEIRDVVPAELPKKIRFKAGMSTSRPSTAPSSGSRAEKSKQTLTGSPPDTMGRAKVPLPSSSSLPPPPAAGPLPKLPRAGSSPRRNPRPETASSKPDWNVSLTVPDRDLLIMEQDLVVDKYKSRHSQYDSEEARMPQPKLADLGSRKHLKEVSSEDKRNRVDHNSFGAAVNDPLPSYPFLRHQTGIHSDRWINDSKLPVEHEDWAKPLPKADKTHDAFEKVYRSKKKPTPSEEINVQHSIASVVSSYTLAEKHSLKSKGAT
jgi:hypothetical protein